MNLDWRDRRMLAGLLVLAAAGAFLAVLGPAGAAVTGVGANWTFTVEGPYDIALDVTDPAWAPNQTYNITVFGINPPSPAHPVTVINITEDAPLLLSQAGGNGTLNWTWSAPAFGVSSQGANISWTFEAPGAYNLTVTVTDPAGNSSFGFVLVNARDITAPTVTIVGPSVTDLLIPVFFTGNVTDNDASSGYANWTLNWTFTNASAIILKSGRTVSYLDGAGGTVSVWLDVRDASGNTQRAVASLFINQPPVFVSQPDTEANTTQLWSWTVDAFDPEGADTTVAVTGPPGMSVSGHLVSWTPPANATGTATVSVSVSDGLATVYRNFTLYVVDPALVAGNRKPVFDSEPPLDARVSRAYLYDILVHDADNDTVEITVSGLAGYQYNATTNRLTWTPPWQPSPDEVFERAVPVTITAFDGRQASTQEFTIRFRNPPNQWPVLVGFFSIGTVHRREVLRVNVPGNWSDPDDWTSNLTFVVNTTDAQVRAQVGQILRWHVEPPDHDHSVLVIEVIGEGVVEFNMSARDPSGGLSDSSYVRVNALKALDPPPPAPILAAFPLWLLIAIAGGGAAGAVGLAVALRRSRSAGEVAKTALETVSRAPGERVVVRQAPAGAAPGARKDTYVIEGVFIIYKDGRLVFSRTNISQVKFEDPYLVGSMFSAVQSFIKDSFQTQGELNRLGFGENSILIEPGSTIYIAAVIFGEPTPELSDEMRETIRSIENAYAGIIEDWDGSTTSLAAIEQYVAPLLASTSLLTRADVKQALTEKVVKMLSELEFFQGFVRLKCGVKNDTEDVITKVTVSVDFNEDVLRLHHVEPTTLKVSGSETQLGVLNPGEKTSVAYYFDPQICTESQIDGVARYRDSKGVVRSLSMKPRKAEVVCPIFFTKEHANTAMLKRLMEGELDQRDSKVFNITAKPAGLGWTEIFGLVKEVVLAHDVHLVRDFVRDAPYHGEAWFYGETKVKGYKIVIRASVMEDGSRLEFFAASTQIRAITGLLAEFNHTLQSIIGRKYATLKIEAEFNEDVKQDIQKKSLMAQMGEGELEGSETDQQG